MLKTILVVYLKSQHPLLILRVTKNIINFREN